MSTLENVMAEEKEQPVTYPLYQDKPTGELWGRYQELNHIDPEARVHKPREREKRVQKHTETLAEKVEAMIGEDTENIGEEEAKKKSAKVISHLVYEGKKALEPDAKFPDDENIRQYLQEAGINASFEDLLEETMNTMYSAGRVKHSELPEGSNLKKLIEYVASTKDSEGKEIALLQQTLARYEHFPTLKELVSESVSTPGHKVKFFPTAKPADIFQTYAKHLNKKNAEYDAYTKSTAVGHEKAA